MSNRIDILEYNGDGYMPLIKFEAWRVALINSSGRFKEENFTRMERHNLTDEAFILLQGKATLLVGEEQHRYEMEIGKIYNILKGEWHQIFTSDDAKVLIVENDNTSKENSEYLEIVR